MINEVQYNGNGTVTFVDFCNLMFDKLQDADTKKELEEAFKLFDKEGNG
jgi:Ca2+-binding EF-hand superfamily protein